MQYHFPPTCFQRGKVQRIWSNVYVKTIQPNELDTKKEGFRTSKNTSTHFWFLFLNIYICKILEKISDLVDLILDGLMVSIGRDYNNVRLPLQSFQELLVILIRPILMLIQKMQKHHHQTMLAVGMKTGRRPRMLTKFISLLHFVCKGIYIYNTDWIKDITSNSNQMSYSKIIYNLLCTLYRILCTLWFDFYGFIHLCTGVYLFCG